MLWDLARGFRDHVRATGIDSEYALFAEYFIDVEHERVHAVHFVLCDASGDWVMVDLQNNHHPDFQEVAPRTAEDCGRLVAVRMAHLLDEMEATSQAPQQ
jgi:hypothetical protein